MDNAIFLGLNALGDTLCTTPLLPAFRRQHPHARITYITQSAGFCRVLDDNPDIDLLLYSERMYLQGIPEQTADWIRSLPVDLTGESLLYRLDLKLACTSHEAFRQHISRCFASVLGIEIDSVRPLITLSERERRAARLLTPRPYVVFSMHSVANPERDDKRGRKKDWPIERWRELAARIEALGEFDVLLLAAERDPPYSVPGARPMYGLPIKVAAAMLESAACLVTLESGVAHLAAAVDAPMVEIYGSMMPVEWATPVECTQATMLYGDPFDLSCDDVFNAVERTLCARMVPA